MGNEALRSIPGVDRLIAAPRLRALAEHSGVELVTGAVRHTLAEVRAAARTGGEVPPPDELIERAHRLATSIASPSLKPVLNATGVVLHTNLGRAPLGEAAIEAVSAIAGGYSNLELDLDTGERGSRHAHLARSLAFLTGAEDAIVVNNNAAAVLLALEALADDGEVIVSRGELIEIGGSFRMPDIMRASGARMVEVGTTNRTRIGDYEAAITDDTRVLFKAHKSNFYVGGFAQEVEVGELADLAARRGITFVYDIGSGLLNRPDNLGLDAEPDVRGAISAGADVVTFSCDKLLGGPQAGVLAGRREVVARLSAHPLMRAVRVGKMTIAALAAVVRAHLHGDPTSAAPILAMLSRDRTELRRLANSLANNLKDALAGHAVEATVVDSTGRSGGGTLPDVEIPSCAVRLPSPANDKRFAERVRAELLQLDRPVLAVVRGKALHLDVLSLFERDLTAVAAAVSEVVGSVSGSP